MPDDEIIAAIVGTHGTIEQGPSPFVREYWKGVVAHHRPVAKLPFIPDSFGKSRFT